MRRMCMAVFVAALVLAGCTKKDEAGAAGSDEATEAGRTDDAIEAAEAWLAIVDEGRYGDSWTEACAYFRKAVAKGQWERQAAGVRAPLGKVLSRELDSATPVTELPGAPDGEYVVIQYKTSFRNKAHAIETVTPMRDADGVFRVSGYFIR